MKLPLSWVFSMEVCAASSLSVCNVVKFPCIIWDTSRKNSLKNLSGTGHSPYSLDLAPCDVHVFGPVKEVLVKRRYHTDEEIQNAAWQWLSDVGREFFSNIIKKSF